MNRLVLIGLLATAAFSLLFASCGSDKSSTEACLYETTMNLDKGNYDAVINSPCVNTMQLGAAYFGKAGFDIKDVINRLSETGSDTSGVSELNTFMTTLIPEVSEPVLNNLGLAKTNYCSATGGSISTVSKICSGGSVTNPYYYDANFYISLVDTVQSLSLMRVVLPNILDANGNLNTACDKNANGVPDDGDATACALIAASNISAGTGLACDGATYVRSTPLDLTLTSAATGTVVVGTYSGLTISVTGTGSTSGCTVTPPNPDNATYKRLLYKDNAGLYWVATTSSDICRDASSNQWPCPIVQGGQPLDLVTAIDNSLTSAISSLDSSLTGTLSTDVQQAITDIKAQACCGCITTPCQPCTTPCDSAAIADYLTNNLK